MSRFFVNLLNKLVFPKNKLQYLPEVLEAAEIDECDPSEIFWCDDCEAFHKDYYK